MYQLAISFGVTTMHQLGRLCNSSSNAIVEDEQLQCQQVLQVAQLWKMSNYSA